MGFTLWFLSVNFELVAWAMHSSWSVLTIILHISKELWSSSRAQSHSVLMISWSYPHMAWWLSPIHVSWASDQKLPLPKLQEVHTLFLYFLWAVPRVTSSVSEHVKQSPEANSILELATFSINTSKSDEALLWLVSLSLSWSLVLLEVPTTIPSSGSAVALVWLEEELVGSCPCGLELGPASSTNLDVFSSPFVELHSLPTLTSWELTWVCLLYWSPRVLLEGHSPFFYVGLALNPAKKHPTRGVPTRGISRKGSTERGGFQFE